MAYQCEHKPFIQGSKNVTLLGRTTTYNSCASTSGHKRGKVEMRSFSNYSMFFFFFAEIQLKTIKRLRFKNQQFRILNSSLMLYKRRYQLKCWWLALKSDIPKLSLKFFYKTWWLDFIRQVSNIILILLTDNR